MQRQNLKSLVHPLLLEFVRDSTSLVDDVVSIIGIYWLTLYEWRPSPSSYVKSFDYYDGQDTYECLDGPRLNITQPRLGMVHRRISIKNVFQHIRQEEVEHCLLRGACVLGKNEENVYILRIVSPFCGVWKTSMSLQILLQHMPAYYQQELVIDQQFRQENELQISEKRSDI